MNPVKSTEKFSVKIFAKSSSTLNSDSTLWEFLIWVKTFDLKRRTGCSRQKLWESEKFYLLSKDSFCFSKEAVTKIYWAILVKNLLRANDLTQIIWVKPKREFSISKVTKFEYKNLLKVCNFESFGKFWIWKFCNQKFRLDARRSKLRIEIEDKMRLSSRHRGETNLDAKRSSRAIWSPIVKRSSIVTHGVCWKHELREAQ